MCVRRRTSVIAMVAVLLTALFFGACARSPVRNDPVTSGMAERSIVVGQTSQQQILETFGAPNIVTKRGSGGESWTYERVSFDSSYASGGLGVLGGGAPGSAIVGGSASVSGGSSSSGTRTATLIIYFDENEIVSDYRVMETHF